ncbi:LADA_0C09054g1_1 [Lachancea dasiensis]|uniref:LADA_0C09054g1_1 n=1 Tax=Lachancea dasiensis TaxID=1072105 RepID=A0A1G4J0U0_9SACH|nr:LADA_0C09054g1_1 [Lachancea dasiensis]
MAPSTALACALRSLPPRSLAPRSFVQDARSTADSFKSWDTCMDNKTCKIVAIVGIVVACVVAIWIVGSLLRCFVRGASGFGEFCCWCCCRSRTPRAPVQTAASTGPVAPPGQVPPMVVYQPIAAPTSQPAAYYQESHSVEEIEQDFDLEAQRLQRDDRLPASKPAEHYNMSVYHPRLTTTPYPRDADGFPADEPPPSQYHYRHGNY